MLRGRVQRQVIQAHENAKSEAKTQCPGCGRFALAKWFDKASPSDGRRYGIFRCGKCSSAFVLPRPSTEYLDEFYASALNSHVQFLLETAEESYFEKVIKDESAYPNSTIDSVRIARECKNLVRGNAFLDIGAGYGFFSRAAAEEGFSVTAIEPAREERIVFKRMNGFEALPGMLTEEFVSSRANSFDVVLMSQVLEHVLDVHGTIGNLRALLRPGGIAAIAVPHFGSWVSRVQGKRDMWIVPPEHLNFFCKKGLQDAFLRHGLICERIHTVTRFDPAKLLTRISVRPIRHISRAGAKAICRLSDFFQSGTVINAYFRKAP